MNPLPSVRKWFCEGHGYSDFQCVNCFPLTHQVSVLACRVCGGSGRTFHATGDGDVSKDICSNCDGHGFEVAQ